MAKKPGRRPNEMEPEREVDDDGPDVFDAADALIEQGDVRGLMEHIRTNLRCYDTRACIKALRAAMARASSRDFDDFVRLVLEGMISFSAELMLFAQVPAARGLNELQDEIPRHTDCHVRSVIDRQLPQIERLHHHIVGLTKAYATVAHTLSLAGAKATQAPEGARASEQLRPTVMKLVRETEDVADAVAAPDGRGAKRRRASA